MQCTKQCRVILVTGANRGIGFEVVKKLSIDASRNNTIILLGCRDLERGHNARTRLDFPSNVHVLQLDISSRDSITRAIVDIQQDYGGQIDVLINNAAISTTEISVHAARQLFETNYYGIKFLNECLIPLMRQNGRIINVTSRVGPIVLKEASQELREKYTSSTLTSNQLDDLVEGFISAIEMNSLQQHGYNPASNYLIYGVTKAALNSLTRIEARDCSSTKDLLIASVTPGLCATNMTRDFPDARAPELGADSILYLVNTPRFLLVNGGFYRDGQQLPFIHQ
jgi:carbonyl reductase 1